MESSRTDVSITAPTVAAAFERALRKGHSHLFFPGEADLIKHFYQHNINAIPEETMNGKLGRFLTSASMGMQSDFFKIAVGEYYELFIMLRKYLIRCKAEEMIANGARHVIVYGGGCDVTALLLSLKYPHVKCYELDRGITRQAKLSALDSLAQYFPQYKSVKIETLSPEATVVNGNLFYLNCDFKNDDLEKKLISYEFNPDEITFLIKEGLSMYLDEQENLDTLNTSTKLLNHPNSELIIGYSVDAHEDSIISKFTRSKSSEDYKFYLTPDAVISFAAKANLGVVEKKLPTSLLDKFEKESAIIRFNADHQYECYYVMKNLRFIPQPAKLITDVPEVKLFIPPAKAVIDEAIEEYISELTSNGIEVVYCNGIKPQVQHGQVCKLIAGLMVQEYLVAHKYHSRKPLPLHKDHHRFDFSLRQRAKQEIGSKVGEVYGAQQIKKSFDYNDFKTRSFYITEKEDYKNFIINAIQQKQPVITYYDVHPRLGEKTRQGKPGKFDGNSEHAAVIAGYYFHRQKMMLIIVQWNKFYEISSDDLYESTSQLKKIRLPEKFYKSWPIPGLYTKNKGMWLEKSQVENTVNHLFEVNETFKKDALLFVSDLWRDKEERISQPPFEGSSLANVLTIIQGDSLNIDLSNFQQYEMSFENANNDVQAHSLHII